MKRLYFRTNRKTNQQKQKKKKTKNQFIKTSKNFPKKIKIKMIRKRRRKIMKNRKIKRLCQNFLKVINKISIFLRIKFKD